jgi:hypothetical protein
MKVLTLWTFVLVLTEAGGPHRGSSSAFLAHLQSLCATEILEHVIIITKRFLDLFEGIDSALPQPDTKLDCMTLLEIILHYCDAVRKHTFT